MAALQPIPPKPKPIDPFAAPTPAVQPYGAFTGTAPAPTPYGTFTPPSTTGLSQAGQFRFDQGQKAIERGAASRGTLLTGGLQARLQAEGQNVASQEADNDYRRALSTYETNRGTNAMNFGQAVTGFDAGRSAYTTNRDTAMANTGQQRDAYRDALSVYDVNRDTAEQNYANERTAFHDALDAVPAPTSAPASATAMPVEQPANWGAPAAYQQQMLDYAKRQSEERRQQEAAMALQEQQRADAERARQEMDRQRLENEAIQRAASARQNAATNAVPFAVPARLPIDRFGVARRR
jgi:hypothetical protein